MASFRIISKSKVQLQFGDHRSPANLTIPLSFFDARFVAFPLINIVLLYPKASGSSSSFRSFKSSLACTLPHFYPLGGDLTYLPSSNDAAIICSKDSSVLVIEAESDLSICRLTDDADLDVESFLQLLPKIAEFELPVPILSVQFTSFSNGGFAVGISTHHAAMDAWGLWQFIDCWAKVCREGAVPLGLAPMNDRAVISYPNKEEIKKQMLKLHASNLPKTNLTTDGPTLKHIQSAQRFFTVDLQSVKLLKQRVVQGNNAPVMSPPTTFQAIAAHFWISMARAKGLTSEDMTPTFLIIPMDCRSLLDPPIDAAYTGNCIRSVVAESSGTSLLAIDGLSKTCARIAKAIAKAKKQPLGGTGMNNPVQNFSTLNGLKIYLSGSPWLQVYGSDFGWGKPSLHAFVAPNCDGAGLVTTGREEGTVQLTVGLKEGMEEFVRVFEGGFSL